LPSLDYVPTPCYNFDMTIEQTIEIPAAHRIFLDLPLEFPVGRAKMELTITPEPALQEKTIKSLKSLFGIHRNLDTIDAYFERKRVNKALEDAQFERNRKAQ